MYEREGLLQRKNGERVFNFRPLFFSAVFLVLGVLFAYHQKIDGVSAWWLCLLLPVLITPFFFYPKKDKLVIALCVLLLCFAIGNIAFSIAFANYGSATVYSGSVSVVGRVVEMQQKGESITLILDTLYLNGFGENGKLIAYLPLSFAENIRLGDELVMTGTVQVNEAYSPLYGLRGGWIADNVLYSLYSPTNVTVTGHTFDLFLEIRQRMTERICLGMDEGAAALTLAILLGDTSRIEGSILQNIRMGGIAHVFAVSGLHVGALYAFFRFLAKKCKFSKLLTFGFVFFVLVAYGGVCGYSASVIRAIITCLCFYLAREIGVKADFLEIIGGAAIVVLLLFPTLLFDVGFQLSYGACMGLSCFSKPFTRFAGDGIFFLSTLGKSKEERIEIKKQKENTPPTLWENGIGVAVGAIVTTLAAQTFTLPITVNTFGYLSLLSVPLNCLVVPILVALFPVFLGLVAIACVLPAAASVYLLYLPAVLWHTIVLPFELLDLSKTAVVGLTFSGGATMLYCAALVLISGKVNLKGWKKWGMVGVYAILFLLAMIVGNG